MPRAIWRGAISFGMVSIPVKLYTATESKDVSFRQLVAEDMKPLKQLRWSPTLDREVQYDELIKGYEYAKDQYVIVDDEDFEKLPVPSKHTITITAFVEASEIDPVYYEKAYQLDPDEAGVRPFALLMRSMEAKGLVAIGKLALRQKEHLVVLRTVDDRIMLETLFYPDEVRPRCLARRAARRSPLPTLPTSSRPPSPRRPSRGTRRCATSSARRSLRPRSPSTPTGTRRTTPSR